MGEPVVEVPDAHLLPDPFEWAGSNDVRCRCGAEMDMSVAHLHDCEYHDPWEPGSDIGWALVE